MSAQQLVERGRGLDVSTATCGEGTGAGLSGQR